MGFASFEVDLQLRLLKFGPVGVWAANCCLHLGAHGLDYGRRQQVLAISKDPMVFHGCQLPQHSSLTMPHSPIPQWRLLQHLHKHFCCTHMLHLLLVAFHSVFPPENTWLVRISTFYCYSRPTCGPLLSIVCTNSRGTHTHPHRTAWVRAHTAKQIVRNKSRSIPGSSPVGPALCGLALLGSRAAQISFTRWNFRWILYE